MNLDPMTAVDDRLGRSAAREHVVPRESVAPLTEASIPLVGTTVACTRLHCSDSYVPNCWPPSTEVRVPPVGTTVNCVHLDCTDFCVPHCFSGLSESVHDMKGGLSVAADVVLPEVCLVVFVGAAAVPVSLPAVAGVVSSAVFAGGISTDASPLADEGMVTDGVTVLTDAGSELPAELLESVCVTKDCLSVDVDVALPEVSPAVFAGAAAVPVSLPIITGVVSSAVFTGGGRC